MHSLVLFAHPQPESLTGETARTLAAALRTAEGHTAEVADLAADGFVEMRHGQGTFVQEVSPFLRDEERATRAQELVRTLLTDAARLGIGADEIARAFQAEIGVEIRE